MADARDIETRPPGGDTRSGLVRWLEGVRAGEIAGGPG
jgi:hypothetical protein